MRVFQSVSGHSSQQSITRYSSQPTVSQLQGVSDTISKWIKNLQPQRKQISTVANASFIQTRIEWPPVLITAAYFPSLQFQILQYPRQRLSYPVHRAALMTKTVSILPAFSSRFVDFAVQFCFRCKFSFHEERRSSKVWQWRDFLGPIKILLLRLATIEIASFI